MLFWGVARVMSSAVARVYIVRVWGLCPQWGPEAKFLVKASGRGGEAH